MKPKQKSKKQKNKKTKKVSEAFVDSPVTIHTGSGQITLVLAHLVDNYNNKKQQKTTKNKTSG